MKLKKCLWCGKPFKATFKRKKYCSDFCRYEARKEQKRLWLYRNYRKMNNYYVIPLEDSYQSPNFTFSIYGVACFECESKDTWFDHKRAELVCKSCGLVIYSPNRYVAYSKVEYQ